MGNGLIVSGFKNYSLRNRSGHLTGLLFIYFIAIVGLRCWSFHGLPDKLFDILEIIVSMSLTLISVYNFRTIKQQKLLFLWPTIFFITLPLLSAIPAAIFHNQPPQLSLLVLRGNFFWLLYFVLHYFKIAENKLIFLMIVMGVVWAVLTIGQQFTYPNFYFYTRDGEDGQDFIRGNTYRFLLADPLYGFFLIVYCFNQLVNEKKLLHLLGLILGLVSFYYYSVRIADFACLICLLVLSMTQNSNVRKYAMLFMSLSVVIMVIFKEELFGAYIDMTKDDISSENIRNKSSQFFLFEYWPHWSTFLIGNGYEHLSSSYGKEMIKLNNIGYYKADVGLIGALNTFGVFYAMNIIWLNVKGLFIRFNYIKANYLKMSFLYSLLILVLYQTYAIASSITFFCLIFYLIERSYENDRFLKNILGSGVAENLTAKVSEVTVVH